MGFMSVGRGVGFSVPKVIRIATVSSLFALALSAASSTSHATSYATAYDMDIFLNQPHPFDTAAAPAPVFAPAAVPTGMDGGGDDFGGMDDLDDLLAEDTSGGEANDPLEPMNRFIFGFNLILEDFIFRPVAYTYNAVVPDPGRTAISNFLDNLSSPIVLLNDLLQGEFGRAFDTTQRMLINTTIGIGGLWDAAAWMGIEEHREDFGQTLAVWGVGEGFYLVLPVLGPSNPRDAIGKFGVDSYLDPVNMWLDDEGEDELYWARVGMTGLVEYADIVEELDTLRETSLDYYAAIRSLYRQKRDADIRNAGALSTGTSMLDAELEFVDIPD